MTMRRLSVTGVRDAVAAGEELLGRGQTMIVDSLDGMAAPKSKTPAKAATPKSSGRYDASGMRVLSNKDRDKVRALGKKAKPFRSRIAKSA